MELVRGCQVTTIRDDDREVVETRGNLEALGLLRLLDVQRPQEGLLGAGEIPAIP